MSEKETTSSSSTSSPEGNSSSKTKSGEANTNSKHSNGPNSSDGPSSKKNNGSGSSNSPNGNQNNGPNINNVPNMNMPTTRPPTMMGGGKPPNRKAGMAASVMETRVSIRASRAPAYLFNENTDLMVIPPLRHILSKDQFRSTLVVANKQLVNSKHTEHVWNHRVWSTAHRTYATLFYVILIGVLAITLYDGQDENDLKYIYTVIAIDIAIWVFIGAKLTFTQQRARKICDKVAAKAAEKLPGKDAGIIKVGCEWTSLDYVLQIDVRMISRNRPPGARQ